MQNNILILLVLGVLVYFFFSNGSQEVTEITSLKVYVNTCGALVKNNLDMNITDTYIRWEMYNDSVQWWWGYNPITMHPEGYVGSVESGYSPRIAPLSIGKAQINCGQLTAFPSMNFIYYIGVVNYTCRGETEKILVPGTNNLYNYPFDKTPLKELKNHKCILSKVLTGNTDSIPKVPWGEVFT